ncbi:MAG: polysaccharide biosynthesis/export family protein [Cyclobacteriaceae bacterium]|nr:polysaccharide biosynthesis/export family protein [Cyclobacteriaceae bacterium]
MFKTGSVPSRILLFVIGALILNSCVVNRKYQYLQNDDVNVGKNEIKKDTVLRIYDLSSFEYKLQPEDILSVQFHSLTPEEYDFFSIKNGGNNNYNQFQNNAAGLVNGYLVDENGDIEFPVVGKVRVSGFTIFEAQNHILDVARQYLKDPIVEVRLLNFRYTMLGEVKEEGTFTSLNNRITMIEAIGLAGGLTDLGDKSNIKVIRQGKGKAEVYYLDLLDESFINSPYYYVNQNDIIIIPPLKQRPYQVYFGKNLALVISSVSLLLIVLNLVK